MANRPDIIIKRKEVSERKTTCKVIDVAIPADPGMPGKRK